MLTVDYDRLGLQAGDRLLDLGCGFGRHAFEAARRGANIVASDLAIDELKEVANTFAAMSEAGELDGFDISTAEINGDATCLPFADNSFDRIIASEVLEHIPNDIAALSELSRILKPGGVLAATVPTFLPEKLCWSINSDYHAPTAVGGHVRIYTRDELKAKMTSNGLEPFDAHNTHALHSPYWWLKCAVGIDNQEHPLVKKYHDLLVWEITDQPKVLQLLAKVLDPVIGKSTVIYARKPGAVL